MELREWLIILGLALVTLIVIDGVRRLKRQRSVPRLDQDNLNQENLNKSAGKRGKNSRRRSTVPVEELSSKRSNEPSFHLSDEPSVHPSNELYNEDPEEAARNAQIDWELPNGGARIVRPATQAESSSESKHEHRGTEDRESSGIFSDWRRNESKVSRPASQSASIRDTALERRRAIEAEARAGEKTRVNEAVNVDPNASSEAASGVTGTVRQNPTDLGVEDNARAENPSQTKSSPRAESAEPDASDLLHSNEWSGAADEEPAHQPGPPSRSVPLRANFLSEDESQHGATQNGATNRAESDFTKDDDKAASLSRLKGLAADPQDRAGQDYEDEERYRMMDFDSMGNSLRSHSSRMGQSVQRFGSSVQKNLAQRKAQRRQGKEQREKEKLERKALETSRQEQKLPEAERQTAISASPDETLQERSPLENTSQANVDEYPSDAHPSVEKALRNHVEADHAQDALSNAEEIIVISVLAKDPQGFSGTALLELMLACGLRYSRDMGIFNRFETEEPDSELQFSVVNVVKPGTFPLDTMDEFATPGITLLMPLPGAVDSASTFEAMFETAMVIVRHLGGELKDEQRSVMTAQTVEFARQRVKEFERRHRLHRHQAN